MRERLDDLKMVVWLTAAMYVFFAVIWVAWRLQPWNSPGYEMFIIWVSGAGYVIPLTAYLLLKEE